MRQQTGQGKMENCKAVTSIHAEAADWWSLLGRPLQPVRATCRGRIREDNSVVHLLISPTVYGFLQ